MNQADAIAGGRRQQLSVVRADRLRQPHGERQRHRALHHQQGRRRLVTSTFTGTATITPYLDPNLTMPDSNVGAFTGHLTEWFGGSFKPEQRRLPRHLSPLGHERRGDDAAGTRRITHEHERGEPPRAAAQLRDLPLRMT
jgi:hypothetical protein